MRYFSVVAVLFFVLSFSAAKPVREPEQKKVPEAKAPLPLKLPQKTNWGGLKQEGLKFVISGNPAWWGEGEVRPDQKTVVIYWISLSDGKPATGSYLVVDGKLEGRWGWSHEVEETLPGVLEGRSNSETIREVE